MPARMPQGRVAVKMILGLALFLPFVLSACTPTEAAEVATVTPEPAYVATLRPKLVAEMQQLGVPGAIFYVQDPRKGSWTSAMGTGDLATNAPMDENNHMRIGSITKTFTGR